MDDLPQPHPILRSQLTTILDSIPEHQQPIARMALICFCSDATAKLMALTLFHYTLGPDASWELYLLSKKAPTKPPQELFELPPDTLLDLMLFVTSINLA